MAARCRSCLCCCSAGTAGLLLLAALGLWTAVPGRRVVHDACGNPVDPTVRTLPGLPFQCGWQRLRAEGFGGSSHVPYAFVQPNGSWCWSNAGWLGPHALGTPGASGGLLVDTLTDPVLTAAMLDGVDVAAVVFTHPDIDHVFGNQAVPMHVPRYGTREAQEDIEALRNAGTSSKLAKGVTAGNVVRTAADLLQAESWLPALPVLLRGAAIKALSFARFTLLFDGFSFQEVNATRLPEFAELLETGSEIPVDHAPAPVIFRHHGAVHSKSDSVLLLPQSKVAYTGDLLFVGIAPVMWAGPAKSWVLAMDALLEDTDGGEGWIFVPGHGPVTDVQGVRSMRRYFQFLDGAVTTQCGHLPAADPAADHACAEKVLAALPLDVRISFAEPQRILISATIERMSRRAGGPARVSATEKITFLLRLGEHMVRSDLGLGALLDSGRHGLDAAVEL